VSSTYNALSGKIGFFISGHPKCDREEWERINILGVRAPPQHHSSAGDQPGAEPASGTIGRHVLLEAVEMRAALALSAAVKYVA
jgi:hypothetical protein